LARLRPISIKFPLAGLNKRLAFQEQPPWSTPAALNAWPIDPSTGRERGGARPPVKEIGDLSNAPYHWCNVSFIDSGGTTRNGIAICHAGGTNTSIDAADWSAGTENPEITVNPATTFATCAMFHPYLIQARGGGTVYQKVLNAATAEGTLASISGSPAPPTNCGIVITHADRLWLMGDTLNPHRLYASAVGDPLDWDDTDPTPGGAWTNSGAEGGQIGHAITAGLSHDDKLLLVGSANSIYGVRGNPRVSGVFRISTILGPLMQNAWCKAPGPDGEDNTYVVTKSGVFYIPANGPYTLKDLSSRPLPDDLININPGVGDRVAIGYDPRFRMLHVGVDLNTGSDINYSYHIPTDSWWPCSYGSTWHLFPTFPAIQTADKSSGLMVSSVGEVNQYDRTNISGGSHELFDSSVLLGPLRLGGNSNEKGMLVSLTAFLANGSGALDWRLYGGDTAEEAYDKKVAATPDYEGHAFSREYGNYVQYPNRSFAFCYIELYDSDNARWLIEELVAEIESAGPRRVSG
jgi:hypothetical protein